jgi:hypothetical protein
MGRIIGWLPLFLLTSSIAIGQTRGQPKSAKVEDVISKAVEPSSKLRRGSYPQPYNERLILNTDEVSPLEITYDAERKRNVGALTFRAILKNTGSEDFDFVPGDFVLAVVSEKGIQLTVKDVDWNENADGDSVTYRITAGESSGRDFRVTILDTSISVGTRYFVVVSYLHLYDMPAPAIDYLVTVLPVTASEASKGKPAKE